MAGEKFIVTEEWKGSTKFLGDTLGINVIEFC
jgi:hypothetical protein